MMSQACRLLSLCLPPLLLCTSAPAAPKNSAAAPPETLQANAQGVTFNMLDPKHPGKMLGLLRAVSATGQSTPTGFVGSLTSVWARLYQQGAPAAVLTAPHVEGSSSKKTAIVTGTGGVIVKSLTQPGTRLTADQVVWYASLNQIVATGHVFYRDGKTGGTMTGPWMKSDTKLKISHDWVRPCVSQFVGVPSFEH